MEPSIKIEPLEQKHYVLDWMLSPFMHIITATFYIRGKAQQTHRWHVQPVTFHKKDGWSQARNTSVIGDPSAGPSHVFGLPLCHLPFLPGGWRRYVMLEPEHFEGDWHVGWQTEKGGAFVHRLPIRGAVRMLVGPQFTIFFAVDAKTGRQLSLEKVSRGRLWDKRHRRVPLY